MKTFFYLTVFLFGLLSCNSNDDDSTDQQLIGKWQLTEAKISSGGAATWEPVSNGYEIIFNADLTYSTTQYAGCNTGTYKLLNNIITLTNSCGNQTIPNNFKLISISSNELIYNNVLCTEECLEKFKKK